MKKSLITLAALPALTFAACEKRPVSIAPERLPVDVYVAGYAQNGAASQTIAEYCKNDSFIHLTDGTRAAYAEGITVSGHDVYVAGTEMNAGHTFIAKYWKNGSPVVLGIAETSSSAYAIALSGGDVYVAGVQEQPAGIPNPVYWKNGVLHRLQTNMSGGAIANSLALSGSDLYIGGWASNGQHNVALYWKNGNPVILSDGSSNAGVMSIAIYNGDVYACGFVSIGNTSAAVYWKNGQITALDGTTANGITLVNGNVYLAGQNIADARYWKNDTGYPLDGTIVVGVASAGNDIYFAGDESNGQQSVAKYWKNGVPVVLTQGTNTDVVTAMCLHSDSEAL
jgi:hypothetical protein